MAKLKTDAERDAHFRYENTIAAILTVAVLGGQTTTEDAAIKTWARMTQKLRVIDSMNPPAS